MNIRRPKITINLISRFAIFSLVVAFASIIWLTPLNISAQVKRISNEVKLSITNSPDIFVPDENVRVERILPLGKFIGSSLVPLAVDPSAIYSNVTNFAGQANVNGGAADQAGNGITRLVADDVNIPVNIPIPFNLTGFRFSVANLNAAAVSARPRVRFYSNDGAGGGPGTVLPGYSFNAIAFAPGVAVFSATVAAVAVNTRNLWMGITFDNNTGATGATLVQLDMLGQGIFTPVDLGSSTDTIFRTTLAGSFFSNNPAGAQENFGGVPVANFGWEILATPPTAAAVSVGGRILAPNGMGIPRAAVYMTDNNGVVRSSTTNSFGYYRFEDVGVGQTYIFHVFTKEYQFTPQVVSVEEGLSNLDFIAQ